MSRYLSGARRMGFSSTEREVGVLDGLMHAIVQVQGCIETRSGARVYTTYSGYLELGRDGYGRALRESAVDEPVGQVIAPAACHRDAASHATEDHDD